MKEPQPDENGMVCWNGIRLADVLIDWLKERGYKWDEKEEAYKLTYEQMKELNRGKTVDLKPISFQPDEFHRAVHPPYGGDCQNRQSDCH